MDAFSPLLLTPLPGSPVWDDAKKRGLVSDDMVWSILREEFNEIPDRHIIMSEVLSRDELYCLYMKFKRLSKRKLIYLGMKHPYLGLRETMRILKRKFHFAKLLFLKSTIKTDTKL